MTRLDIIKAEKTNEHWCGICDGEADYNIIINHKDFPICQKCIEVIKHKISLIEK